MLRRDAKIIPSLLFPKLFPEKSSTYDESDTEIHHIPETLRGIGSCILKAEMFQIGRRPRMYRQSP